MPMFGVSAGRGEQLGRADGGEEQTAGVAFSGQLIMKRPSIASDSGSRK